MCDNRCNNDNSGDNSNSNNNFNKTDNNDSYNNNKNINNGNLHFCNTEQFISFMLHMKQISNSVLMAVAC